LECGKQTTVNGQLDSSFLSRLLALIRKEFGQIRRNKPLIISLIVPPTIQIVLFGFALNPTVDHLRLGVVDESRSHESRDLAAAFTANSTFSVQGYYSGTGGLEQALHWGELDTGLVIPADYARQRARQTGPVAVQLLFNAMDANTAGIAQGYAANIVAAYNQTVAAERQRPIVTVGAATASFTSRVALLYNPGLISAWFVITGTFGILLILNGSLMAATTMSQEKESGTLEQLLMTPAGTTEIIIAKVAPLFMLLMLDVALVLVIGGLVFGVPVRGSLGLIFLAGALCVLTGIGIGTFVATFTKSGLQAKLLSFFINPPMALLSGATTPVEAMPKWMQPLTMFNPVRHFSIIARGVMIKGIGLDILYPNFLALFAFAFVLVTLSVSRYRKQLA
jgi:ABC-2 type transport system permease protein